MKIEVSDSFYKDAGRITHAKTREQLAMLIEFMENASRLNEIPSLKKLKGYRNAYRIRLGNYRLGFLFVDRTIKLGRFLSRKDIYKYFP